jgi:hypothetical protein
MKEFDAIWDVTYLRRWIAKFRLRTRARDAIGVLCPQYISQRELERLLWLSQGYLSRLFVTHGPAVPSAALVALLALLAAEPSRLDELRKFWEKLPKPARADRKRTDDDKEPEPS